MVLRPGFAVGAFVFADNENGNIRALRKRDGFFDFLRLHLWIYEFNVVIEPSSPILMLIGEAAALGEDDLRLRPDALLNSLQDGDAMRRITTVSAEVQAIGVRADYWDRLQFA